MMDEISSIKTFFESHNVHLSSAWLEGCVNWCKEENLPANYTLKDLQHKVFEQWLLLDLRDVEVPSLPPDIPNKIKFTLNGNYSLQVMKIIDISKPKHWQLHRIRNSEYKNTETDFQSSKRVLQLTLTDGVQEVEAMEYTPISCLNLNLSPGIKIRLLGPITVRRGRLMLEEKNIKVLGGEVEDLIIPNAAENVLASILKLPINPKPNVIEESLLTANKDIFNEEGQARPTAQSKTTARMNIVNPPSNVTNSRTIRGDQLAGIPNKSHTKNSTRNNIVNPSTVVRSIRDNPLAGIPSTSSADPFSLIRQSRNQVIDANEELMIAAEMMEMDEDFEEEEPTTKRRKSNKTPDLFDDGDFDDSVFENIEIPPTIIKTTAELSKMLPPTSSKTKTELMKILSTKNKKLHITNTQASLELENDLFENLDVDAHLNQITKESEWRPHIQHKPLVITIEKLIKNMPNISNGKFKIKAKFGSIVEKLTVVDDEYYMIVKVTDETQELTVKIHSDVVSEFAGFYPTALTSLKQAVLENNVEARAKVLKALRNIKERLVQLNNIIEVQVNVKEKFPVIVKVLE